ncbi:unannotated protein [freshwater metagenome]|uniref:Unannotated protein n=1 Tax=freshwater metagenome TaxID=449393 RepID=A0A6J6DFQ1_9ZZZZ
MADAGGHHDAATSSGVSITERLNGRASNKEQHCEEHDPQHRGNRQPRLRHPVVLLAHSSEAETQESGKTNSRERKAKDGDLETVGSSFVAGGGEANHHGGEPQRCETNDHSKNVDQQNNLVPGACKCFGDEHGGS